MSHVSLRENIKTRIEHADLATLQSIWEIFDRSERRAIAMPEPAAGSASSRSGQTAVSEWPLQFVGENLTLEEFERLSLKERAELKRGLKERNRQWLDEKFSALAAAWVMVIDGEVIASGKNLKDKPRPPQTVEISRRTGKFPFVFVNEKFITIEEGASLWHKMNQTDDYYPTLPVKLSAGAAALEMTGDLDTGSSHTFVDYDFLIAQNIVHRTIGEEAETHLHLNKRFDYFDKFVRIELHSAPGEARVVETWISCVQDWNLSPFVAINPERRALLGRDILLQLKPRVMLDFEKLQTEIITAAKTKPARRKATPKKNSAPPKRRRA